MFWRVLPAGLFAVYLLALLAWGAGTWGWFGMPKDPLSAIGIVALGLPWVRWVDMLPEPLWPLATALMPLCNLALLFLIRRVIQRP